MKFGKELIFALIMCVAAASQEVYARDSEAMSAAPPSVQDEIIKFLTMIAKSQYQCESIRKVKVLSSELSQDAKVSPERVLLQGHVFEIWQANMCGTKVRYGFSLAPNSEGKLALHGFEAVR